jgi:hypothetical protein
MCPAGRSLHRREDARYPLPLGITDATLARVGLPSTEMTPAPSRLDAPLDDTEYTLTIDEVSERYARAGHPRTIRRLQKYCARGDLQCRKVETAFGEKYLVTAMSVDHHIAQIVDALAASGRAPARPDAPDEAQQGSHISESKEVAPPNAPARPDAPNFQARYTDHLEEENKFLRVQNTVLLERVKETNIITARLQEMLAPLLGTPPASPATDGERG